jgi:hypothetical protein
MDEESPRGSSFLMAQCTEAELALLIGVVFEAGSRRTS